MMEHDCPGLSEVQPAAPTWNSPLDGLPAVSTVAEQPPRSVRDMLFVEVVPTGTGPKSREVGVRRNTPVFAVVHNTTGVEG